MSLPHSFNEFIQKFHTWIILLVIIVFGFGAFYSCLKILEEEELYISGYRLKVKQLVDMEESFHGLEDALSDYFKLTAPQQEEKRLVSQTLFDFQSDLNFFYVHKEQGQFILNSKEVVFIKDIQSHIMTILPLIAERGGAMHTGVMPPVVRHSLDEIYEGLEAFEAYQVESDGDYLSDEIMQERRMRIFMAVTMLGISGCFLILFLVYKNNQLEEAHKEKKEIYGVAEQRMAAIEAASDGIGIMDADRRLIYMNDSLANLHGISKEEKSSYLGKDWKELYNRKGQDHIQENVYPFLDALGEWRGESRIMRQDGKVIEAELSLTLLPDNAGMIGTARDITARREAEKENRALQSQVHQAQKMEAVGRLAGGIAHDFNNILAAIMGYAEFLSEDLEKEEKLKAFADNILKAGQKARTLIDQMLAFSRRKESKKHVIDLCDVVEETVSIISPGLSKSIELQTNIHYDGAAYINGDGSLVTQALMNIMVNAVDAMEDERGELNISLSLVEPDEEMYEGMVYDDFLALSDIPPINIQDVEAGHTSLELGRFKRGINYFQISISDTGTGMAKSVMEHIFEPFFTTKSVDKGTGLGMANVHGAVVAHQAAMIIDSVLMEGTTFDLFFPQADYINDPSILGDTDASSQVMDFAGIRILLVDDQEEVLNMLETLLVRAGFECICMLSSIEALEYLREAHDAFDLVITDQNMPKMTGLELIEQVGHINEDLPFIILSGYSHEKLEKIRAGYPSIKDCLRKPAKKDQLLRAIDHVLKETL